MADTPLPSKHFISAPPRLGVLKLRWIEIEIKTIPRKGEPCVHPRCSPCHKKGKSFNHKCGFIYPQITQIHADFKKR